MQLTSAAIKVAQMSAYSRSCISSNINIKCNLSNYIKSGERMKGYMPSVKHPTNGMYQSDESIYCQEGRIAGLSRFGKPWCIPEDAKKPIAYENKTRPRATAVAPHNTFAAFSSMC